MENHFGITMFRFDKVSKTNTVVTAMRKLSLSQFARSSSVYHVSADKRGKVEIKSISSPDAGANLSLATRRQIGAQMRPGSMAVIIVGSRDEADSLQNVLGGARLPRQRADFQEVQGKVCGLRQLYDQRTRMRAMRRGLLRPLRPLRIELVDDTDRKSGRTTGSERVYGTIGAGSGRSLGGSGNGGHGRAAQAGKPVRKEPLPSIDTRQHYLLGQIPARIRRGDRAPLNVRIALQTDSYDSARLERWPIPPDGCDIELRVQTSTAFIIRPKPSQMLHVPANEASDWLLFQLDAVTSGIHRVEILAFNGAAHLGTLVFEVEVGDKIHTGELISRRACAELRIPDDDEVTLEAVYDDDKHLYRYVFRRGKYFVSPNHSTGQLLKAPEIETIDFVNQLNAQAEQLTHYNAEETRYWLQGVGKTLWRTLIPEDVKRLYWEYQSKIKRMTIVSSGLPIPWEAMYPEGEGKDLGFLAEQFPIVRDRYLSNYPSLLRLNDCYFVLPTGSPPSATDEIAKLRRRLHGAKPISLLTTLMKLIETPSYDVLHFACHHIFRPDCPSASYIEMEEKKHFDTNFVKRVVSDRIKPRKPIIFMNACSSDQSAPSYTELSGWSQAFLDMGAGAFIGALWDVRSDTARDFALAFYSTFKGTAKKPGKNLADAVFAARQTIKDRPGDPTWLAYTVYGHPDAILGR